MKMYRKDLPKLLYETISDLGGKAKMIDIFKHFWNTHKKTLENSGEIFYTWNYDIRWAATELRKQGLLKQAGKSQGSHISKKGFWELNKNN